MSRAGGSEAVGEGNADDAKAHRLADTVMRNLYLTAQVASQQEEIRALHEVLRAVNTAMTKYEDEACLSGYTVVAPQPGDER